MAVRILRYGNGCSRGLFAAAFVVYAIRNVVVTGVDVYRSDLRFPAQRRDSSVLPETLQLVAVAPP